MMKRMISLLLVLMLAPILACAENYALREAAPACDYEVIWISASPSGSYLLGVDDEGASPGAPLLLYETATGEGAFLPIAVEAGSDAEKKIKQMLSNPAAIRSLQVIWAPDEMHFTLTYMDTLSTLSGFNGLHIGSIREKKIITPVSWLSKNLKPGGGLLAHAGFSADSAALYYMVAGMAYENRYQLLKYDLATGEETPLFSCIEEIDGGKYMYVFRSLIGVNDDLFLLDESGTTGGFAIFRRENGEWKKDLFLQNMNQSVQRMEYSPETGYGMVLTLNSRENILSAYVFRLDEAGNMLSLEQLSLEQPKDRPFPDQVINFALSPDGEHALLAIQEMGVRGRVMMLKLSDMSLAPVSVPDAVAGNVQALGNNIIAPFRYGYAWGGEYVVGGIGRQNALFTLSGMEKVKEESVPAAGLEGFYTAVYAENNGMRVILEETQASSTIDIRKDGSFTITFGTAGDVEQDQGAWITMESAGQIILLLTIEDETVSAAVEKDMNAIRMNFGDGMFIYYERQQ